MKLDFRFVLFVFLFFLASTPARSGDHPKLVLTKAGVEQIRKELGTVPLFDQSLQTVRAEVDAEIEFGIDTPIPKDFSGGYTHERHKKNFFMLQKAGALFQILDDEKYAIYIRDMLFQYEAMYTDLPLHPQTRSYARGKLFWQCLNDANWLLYVSQAYDAIYDWLSAEERQRLEENLFRPFADFLSVGNPQFFNRIHNHSTWGNAAVGMIGLVMGDDELVHRALYGLEDDGLEAGARDNDGGFIKVEGQDVGFLANLEEPFSPDGYYTEGPYYQRYAMYPFLIFGQSLNNVKPELNIMQHKDGVLLKAVDALLNLADGDGDFFPLNDAQKGMSYFSSSLVTAVDIAYHMGGNDPTLLDVAQKQAEVTLDDAGLAVARGVRDGLAKPFAQVSRNFSDGPDGEQGGVAILRDGAGQLTLVFKYAAQGLSHGHYDKLSYSLYADGEEVLQDYGLVRFVNIEQKGGGNYLPENTSWAKQTIAHNTLTQNETSHFQGKYEIGSQHHSSLVFYDVSDPSVQVVSATETNAYPGTELRRTMAMINDPSMDKPFILDVLKVSAETPNRYDVPIWFFGQVIDVSFDYTAPTELRPLGDKNGYQHLFLEATGLAAGNSTQMQWMDKGRFYTVTTATESGDELMFARLGANDRNFNLRRDPALIQRRDGVSNTTFVSVVEPHGSYSPVSEQSVSPTSSLATVNVLHDDAWYTAVEILSKSGERRVFVVSNHSADAATKHDLRFGNERFRWQGPFYSSVDSTTP